MYGSLVTLSNLIKMNPESPRLRAVSSFLFRTQIVAVALPMLLVRLKLNFKMFKGHKCFPTWVYREFELVFFLFTEPLKLREEFSESELKY